MSGIREYVLRVAATTLSGVILAVVLVLLIGLFSPHVDNNKIFEILAPAFQTVIGAFVGVVGTLAMENPKRANTADTDSNAITPPEGTTPTP